MAAAALLGSVTLNTTNGTKTVTATPTYGDIIVIVTAHTGNTSAAAPTDDNSGSPGTYTQITACASQKATSADTMRVWIRDHRIQSAVSTVFTHAPGTTSGGGLAVIRISGLARTGADAARQGAKQDNQAAATPAPVLGSAALTENVVIGAVFCATNSTTTVAHRGTPAYTELFDNGYATPTTGLEIMKIDSGETASTITWGGAVASAFCASVLELNCVAENVPDVTAMPMAPPMRRAA